MEKTKKTKKTKKMKMMTMIRIMKMMKMIRVIEEDDTMKILSCSGKSYLLIKSKEAPIEVVACDVSPETITDSLTDRGNC